MNAIRLVIFVVGVLVCTSSYSAEQIKAITLWGDIVLIDGVACWGEGRGNPDSCGIVTWGPDGPIPAEPTDPNQFHDLGYAEGTFLNIGGKDIEIKRFEGHFKDRKADGFGRLSFGALASGDHAYLPFYYGGFKNGLPNGYGELSNYGNHSLIKGNFLDGLPDGVSEIFFEDRLVFRINLKNGIPTDGPVQIFHYPDTGSMPSSTFIGTINGSTISGDWSPLPWTAPTDLGQIIAFNDKSNYRHEDGTRIDCVVESYEPDKSIDIKSISWNMPYKGRVYDPQWSGKGIEACTLTAINGWTYGYRTDRWKMKVDPISCSNPSGVPGSFSFAPDKSGSCEVIVTGTKKNNNFFAKIWREIERTPNNVKQGIIHPITELGEEWDKFICSIAGKEPGKNCGSNMSIGISFDLPSNHNVSIDETATKNLDRADAVKNAIGRIAANTEQGPVSEWAQVAAQIYELCAEKCQSDDRREYSLQRILQIETELKSGFDADLRYRRIASFDPELIETLDRVSQYIPVASNLYRAWRGSQHLDRLKEAKEAIENLPAVEFASKEAWERQKAIVDLNRIGLATIYSGEVLPGMIGAWQSSFEAMFPSIPNLPAKTQYSILMGLGLNVQEFLKAHKETITADSWIEAVISEKLKPLGAKIPKKI